MYASIQTVCGCHGILRFETIYCDRCRSSIPYQISDESLIEPVLTNNTISESHTETQDVTKHASVPNKIRQHHHYREDHGVIVGHVRFRALCPFCNSPTYVLRYYCKRERLYYHLRIQQFDDNEQSVYKPIAETQNMNDIEKIDVKHDQVDSAMSDRIEDLYSLNESLSQQQPSTIVFDRNGVHDPRDIQIKNEKNLYPLDDIGGDLFEMLRNTLFYDTILECKDNVKLKVHRCILGSRSPWFRNILAEHHSLDSQNYVLQISMDDIESAVMNEILSFMYTNRCLISLKNASILLMAAKRFGLEKLRKQIVEFLIFRLNLDNALEILVNAHAAGSEALKSACIHLINRNAEKIKRTAKWKKFKTEHVNLVPDLYEDRVERPPQAKAIFLPDVFVKPALLSESFRTLTQLYDNPTKERVTPQMLSSQKQHDKSLPSFKINQKDSRIRSNAFIAKETSGGFPQPNRSQYSPVVGRDIPTKKRVIGNTGRQPAAQFAAPPLKRTNFPSVKQSGEFDPYRRPVNVNNKSFAGPTNNQKQKDLKSPILQKAHSLVPTQELKYPSPKHMAVTRQSPALTDPSPVEQIKSLRAISVETME